MICGFRPTQKTLQKHDADTEDPPDTDRDGLRRSRPTEVPGNTPCRRNVYLCGSESRRTTPTERPPINLDQPESEEETRECPRLRTCHRQQDQEGTVWHPRGGTSGTGTHPRGCIYRLRTASPGDVLPDWTAGTEGSVDAPGRRVLDVATADVGVVEGVGRSRGQHPPPPPVEAHVGRLARCGRGPSGHVGPGRRRPDTTRPGGHTPADPRVWDGRVDAPGRPPDGRAEAAVTVPDRDEGTDGGDEVLSPAPDDTGRPLRSPIPFHRPRTHQYPRSTSSSWFSV